MKVKFAYGKAPGASDLGQRAECQIISAEENGVAALVLADPAFAEGNEGTRARLKAEAAAVLLTERFDEFYAGKVIEINGFDGALLFAAVKGSRYLAGHRGSGLIAGFDGSCSMLSKPEYDDRKLRDMRIYKGERLQDAFGFMLLSDGACYSLYNTGTGNLSSACGTFFEWLKEYDEETVSEALADNIDKYFLKDGQGDIAVAVMFAEQGEAAPQVEIPVAEEAGGRTGTEPEEEQDRTGTEPEEEQVRNGEKRNKFLKILIGVIVVAAAIFVCSLIPPQDGTAPKDQPNNNAEEQAGDNAEELPPIADSADYEPSVTFAVDSPESFDAGVYQVGEDIPPGEYFFWTGEMLKPDSVDVNGFTCLSGELYCLTVRVNRDDTLTSEVRFTMAENVNPIEAAHGVFISGKYKIGKDIAPGSYSIRPAEEDTQGRYYALYNDKISNDTKFSEETTIEVPEEGYIVFYNAVLEVDGQ